MSKAGQETIRKAAVEQYGYVVQVNEGTALNGPYAYTVGLSTMSPVPHPEIVACGFEAATCVALVHNVAAFVRSSGRSFASACVADGVVEGRPVAFMRVSPASVSRLMSLAPMARAVQVFVSDAHGLFPWNEGCDAAISDSQTSLFETEGDLPEILLALPPSGAPMH